MRRLLGGVSLFLAAVAAVPAQQPGNPPAKPPEPPRLVKLAPPAGGPQAPALRYALLPPLADLTPGNAAPVWIRAGLTFQEEQQKVKREDFPWYFGVAEEGKEPPPERVKAFLGNFDQALRLAEQAARCERCDWERPPPTVQNLTDVLPLREIQLCRGVASLLSYRCRLEMKEGQFDKAVHTLQTGFALARHVGNGNTIIESLVGIAIEAIMLGRAEELIQQPGAPNLYWALTDMPSPLVDVRHAFRVEFDTIYRSFPPLRKVTQSGLKPMTVGEAARLVDDLMGETAKSAGGEVAKVAKAEGKWPEAAGALAVAAAAAAELPAARRSLTARGYPAEKVNSLPMQQAVLLFHMSRYDDLRDDLLKWLNLPPWQAHAGLEKAYAAVKASEGDLRTPLVPMLAATLPLFIPSMQKTLAAQQRIERQFAGFRCAEALRLYAAAHGGKSPAKLADVTEAPLPIDPVTGKGFDEFYSVPDGTGVLTVPPPPGMPAQLGRRYELAKPK
jgi:hypothetical protein